MPAVAKARRSIDVNDRCRQGQRHEVCRHDALTVVDRDIDREAVAQASGLSDEGLLDRHPSSSCVALEQDAGHDVIEPGGPSTTHREIG